MTQYIFTLFQILIFCSLSSNIGLSQKLLYKDYIYKDYVATPQVHVNGQIYPNPILELGGNDILTISFDDLDADEKDYYYKIIHCDKDWNPSNLLSIQYIDGFDQEQIETFRFSGGTYIPFTHYYFGLPNRYTNFKLSGNYLLVIYEGKEDNLVLSRRFMIYENLMSVAANNIPPSDVANIRHKQQMQLRVSPGKINVLDPFSDVFVHVLQNNRWDNAKLNLLPRFVRDGLFVYDDFGSISFWGGNEYRYFDMRNLPARGPNIEAVDRSNNEYEVLIKLTKPRDQKHYIYYYDFNGKFLIDSRYIGRDLAGSIIDQLSSTLPDGFDPALYDYKLRGTRLTQDATILSDYAWVIFNLKAPEYYEKDVYIYGGLTDWQIRPEFKLNYDNNREIYLGEVLLKQGFYDYSYVTVEKDGTINYYDVEGSWDETENDYSFLVYFRDFSAIYDRLVGYSTFSSLN